MKGAGGKLKTFVLEIGEPSAIHLEALIDAYIMLFRKGSACKQSSKAPAYYGYLQALLLHNGAERAIALTFSAFYTAFAYFAYPVSLYSIDRAEHLTLPAADTR
jgi:hypothetical protein